MSARWLLGFLACLALFLAGAAWAEQPVPALGGRINDLTNTLSPSLSGELDKKLSELEAHTGSQVAVLLVPSTQPESIEQYSIRVVEKWKLGQKGKDNGVLLLVAKNDRKVRIEVAYGLEGTIPDALAKRVIDESITPAFKRNDFAGGIAAGVQRLADLIEGHPKTAEVDKARPETAGEPSRELPPASLGSVTDLTGTLSVDQTWAWGKELSEFYDSGRTKPAFILVVSAVKPQTMADFAAGVLKTWGERDNLDVDRSILLLIAKDDGAAFIASGAGLGARILPGAREKLVSETIEPQLKKGDLGGAVQSGIKGLESLIDGAIANKTTRERVIEHLASLPKWLIIAILLIGEAVRWFVGPLFGATLMAALVGTGAWFVSGQDMTTVVQATIITFLVVVIGLFNWIRYNLAGVLGGGGGSGGGFSGGGGDFGGGGASGSW